MSQYHSSAVRPALRIPLENEIDLTYRCNNRCRHCWVCLAPNSKEREQELTFEEIVSIVDQARQMGCRSWAISGGEPMIRDDFTEILNYITAKTMTYRLNTNGTLITPDIAHLLKQQGTKMIALYGATADMHDHITRNPGSYDATIRGMHYLKEAGAEFIVQIVPMADNEHQFEAMRSIADSLGVDWRLGAGWLYFAACGNKGRNEEIARQRMDPRRALEISPPVFDATNPDGELPHSDYDKTENRLLALCTANATTFHVDPYGTASRCTLLKDPALRFDLRKGKLQEFWDEFMPSLADALQGDDEYADNCQACDKRTDCCWCPAKAYLEHGRYSAKIEYLCELARQQDEYEKNWPKTHCRRFAVAGVTIRVESDLPITDTTFHPVLRCFEIEGSGESDVVIRHRFSKPSRLDLLHEEVYRAKNYAIFREDGAWVYLKPGVRNQPLEQAFVFNADYSRANVYHTSTETYNEGNLRTLTTLKADAIMLSHVLARRDACYFHCSAASIDGNGFLFMGHSMVGKSTMAQMLEEHCNVICDEHTAVRKWPDGLWIHGSWSTETARKVTAGKVPLKAIFFLEQALENRAERVEDKPVVVRELLAHIIRPLETKEWWEPILELLDGIASQIPCYVLRFDKSGGAFDVLKQLRN